MMKDLLLLGFLFGTALRAFAGTLLALVVSAVIMLGCWTLTPRTLADPVDSGRSANPEE